MKRRRSPHTVSLAMIINLALRVAGYDLPVVGPTLDDNFHGPEAFRFKSQYVTYPSWVFADLQE